MRRSVFAPQPRTRLPVLNCDETFPVRRVYCVGRNYPAHAREMGGDPSGEPPFFFSKPADAVVPLGGGIPFPQATRQLHHEVELVVALSGGGRDLAVGDTRSIIFGYAVGIDLTRRDLQTAAKAAGRPWDMAKGFDASAPCSAIAPVSLCGHPRAGKITLEVNDEPRQSADLSDQLWSPEETLAHLSRLVRLAPGDLVFTGTPEGVGLLAPGDRIRARIEGVGELTGFIEPTG